MITKQRRRGRPAGARSHRRLVGALAASVVLIGILVVGVFPTRTYLAQRAATRHASTELARLDHRNQDLATRIERLRTPTEVERLAREQYGLVRPGEEAYAILPPPPPPVRLPDIWPFRRTADLLNR